MLKDGEIKKVPKDDHPHRENVHSQPLKTENIFNRSDLITESWYPVCLSGELKDGEAKSFTILHHRFVLWRSESGQLSAMDSFCPHMGADLGNGTVVGDKLQCYFHHWTFSPDGKCAHRKDGAGDLKTYPVSELHGFIWIFAGPVATHSVPLPPGLEGQETNAIYFKKVRLYAHHHVMMVGGIDLQHFKSVHHVDIKFDFDVQTQAPDTHVWSLNGIIPQSSFKLKFAHFLTGGEFKYKALFAGGSIVSLTYGNDLRFRGNGFKLPPVSILWGGTPTVSGVSDVDIFLVQPKYNGLFAPVKKLAMTVFSMILLWSLKDDDIKAFPHMRFNLGLLNESDRSVKELVDRINQLKVSEWSKDKG